MRGVDTHERMGPPRLVASGAASPRAVLTAALISLGLAAVCGLALALATTPALILIVGALALVAALLYSGGPRPYAGLGLGELMVFLFFGLMATCGSAYVMVETVPAAAWWGGVVDGPAGGGGPGGEQPPRHPDGRVERQADARGATRRPTDADAVPRLRGRRVRDDRRSAS